MHTSPPRLLVVAGVNGSGKSTLARAIDAAHPGATRWITPDRAMREQLGALAPTPDPAAAAPGAAALDAAWQRAALAVDAALGRAIQRGESVLIETLLASGRGRRWIRRARAHGYHTALVYLGLPEAAVAVARVAERQARGGHAVNPTLVAQSFAVSWAQVEHTAPVADTTFVLDASGGTDIARAGGGLDPELRARVRAVVQGTERWGTRPSGLPALDGMQARWTRPGRALPPLSILPAAVWEAVPDLFGLPPCATRATPARDAWPGPGGAAAVREAPGSGGRIRRLG